MSCLNGIRLLDYDFDDVAWRRRHSLAVHGVVCFGNCAAHIMVRFITASIAPSWYAFRMKLHEKIIFAIGFAVIAFCTLFLMVTVQPVG